MTSRSRVAVRTRWRERSCICGGRICRAAARPPQRCCVCAKGCTPEEGVFREETPQCWCPCHRCPVQGCESRLERVVTSFRGTSRERRKIVAACDVHRHWPETVAALQMARYWRWFRAELQRRRRRSVSGGLAKGDPRP